MQISAVIITFNEEKNIRRCIESLLGVADEILVVDSFSTDQTEAICTELKVKFIQHPFEGHIQQKNYAMQQAAHDWVLSLDADEALTDELKRGIELARIQEGVDGFELNRLTNFCGQWIKHAGWYPDRKIRLWNRTKGCWGGQNPHDKVIMEKGSQLGRLTGDLLHYSFYSIEQHVQTIQKFSSIAAQSAYDNGKRTNFFVNILVGPAFTFFKKYFLQAGFLDGYFGFIISINTAYSRFLKYIKLREIETRNGR
jgi:glycosyltransferase involved in cell wall biosynthesis